MRSHHSPSGGPRRGVILLVVVLMLALFLVVGISFVLYSQSQADISRIDREAKTPDIWDVPPETLLSWALGQLIYPVPDDGGSVFSAMRGHELARLGLGWNYMTTTSGPYSPTNPLQVDPTKTNFSSSPAFGSMANTTWFNGLGPLRTLPSILPGVNEYDMVNYTWHPTDGFIRDPERPGTRTDANQTLKPYAGGFNVPYTYPDRTNMFLAAIEASPIDPVTKQPTYQPRLIMESFMRATQSLPYSQIDPTTSAGSNFWTSNSSPALKYMVLRPRPADMYWNGPNDPKSFPLPGDASGDVKQLPGVPFYYKNASGQMVPGQNDSWWMDLNYPVQLSRNGRKFKPLFAFLILDLDGKINLNMHGNINASGLSRSPHASNQGVGRHEVNISKVLTATTNANVPEWPLLFKGSTTAYGRYGIDKSPAAAGMSYTDPFGDASTATQQALRSVLAPMDFDAIDTTTHLVTTKFTWPMPIGNYESFPQYPGAYDNYKVGTQQPLLNHPLLDQKLRAVGDDIMFGDENMYYLLANDYRKSVLYGLVPNSLGGDGTNATWTQIGTRNRLLVTTTSFDVDSPGAAPWVTSSKASNYQFTNPNSAVVNELNYPSGQPMPTPQATLIPKLLTPPNDYSDFKANDGRANLLSRIDLNRKLTSFYDANGLFVAPNSATIPANATLATNPQLRYLFAMRDRQQFAMDIFQRLVQATGAMTPDNAALGTTGSLHQSAGATNQNYMATRWLAQLAVNMVDYIDDDDIITPFNWNPSPDTGIANGDTGWVYGVEAPKLVINEAYCELANDPSDNTASTSGAKLPFQFNFWLELYNPMPAPNPNSLPVAPAISASNPPNPQKNPNYPAERLDPNKTSQFVPMAQDRMAVQLQRHSQTLGGNYPVYQIQIVDETANPPTSLSSPNNSDGSIVNAQAVKCQITAFMADPGAQATAPANAPTPYPDATFVQPTIGNFNIPTTAGAGNATPNNTGFYVMGPDSKHPFNEQQQQGGITLRPTINLIDQGQTPQLAAATPWGQPTGGTARNALTYQYQGPIPNTAPDTMATRTTHSVVLRRLACPNLDPNPLNPQTKQPVNPAMPYNPYVTVDFITGVKTYDAVQYNSNPIPPTNKNQNYVQPNQRHSIGKVQPYNSVGPKQQQSSAPNPVNNTFFSHNSQTPPPAPMNASANTGAQGQGGPTLDYPFDWLTFLDRPLTNVTEIMNVPSTPPHLLTQAFGYYNSTTKQRDLTSHLAPWRIQDARIYRALEFFTVGDRSPYPGTGGRLAGKININTVFDQPITDAMIDAQANSNYFTQAAMQDIWQGNGNLADANNNSFRNRKQQIMGLTGASQPDKPFMSFAAPVVAANSDPQYPTTSFPTGVGIQNTILPYPYTAQGATTPTPGGTFTPQTSGNPSSISYTPPTINQTPQQIPPYILNELLNKISGHSTVRSNTFAVFLTVGFFEVMDDTTLPVKLGAEITTSSGKAIRHQMFSIVDRTNLALATYDPNSTDPAVNTPMARLRQAPTPPVYMSVQENIAAGTGTSAAAATVHINGGIPTDYDGSSPVVFKTNQIMFLDTGVNQEQVIVNQSVDSTGTPVLQLMFGPSGAKYYHGSGTTLCNYQPGNPGPQGPIDYASPQYRAVVPYTYIIQ